MFCKYLKLKNFKRTALAGYKNVELTFNSPLQVILGTNGCGKTSVMRQATPWVPEPEHFFPGGGKELHAIKEGVEYRLVSTLKSGFKHEFWRDGENLNPGGTGTVQKELVRRYFGLSQEIYELLVGAASFTRLSVAKRRELFTALSPTDLTYALGVYNRLKSALRDTQGVRKHLESRIAQETAKIIDDAEAASIATDVAKLNAEIELLLTNKDLSVGRVSTDADSVINEIDFAMAELERTAPDHTGCGSVLELRKYRDKTLEAYAREEAKRRQMSSEFIEISDTLAELKNRTGDSREDIESRLATCDEKIRNTRSEYSFTLPEELRIAHQETEEFEVALSQALTKIVGFISGESDFSKEAQDAHGEKIDTANANLIRIRKQLDVLTHRQEHLNQAAETSCPKCSTRFVPGERPGERDKLEEQIARGQVAERQAVDALAELQRVETEFVEFREHVQVVRQLATTYRRCRGLFNAMIDAGLPYATTQSTIGLIWLWKAELKEAHERKQAIETKERLLQALEQVKLAEGDHGLRLSERSRKLEAEIYECGLQVEALRTELARVDALIAKLDRFEQALGQLEQNLIPTYQTITDVTIAQLRNRFIDEVLDAHYSQLGLLTGRLKQRDVAVALLADLEAQLVEAKDREIAYKVLIDELSPTNGLIAEQLTGFIAAFVKSMNSLIERVWTYPFRVLPCGVENDDLDYRFPIEVGDDRTPASDVSCGSEAQRDFVDFVFAVVLGLYVDPDGFPLYLDELGASFDEEHRSRVWQFVRDFIDAGRAPQAFMISHYAANHTAISGADLVVIDQNNVTVPRKFNVHAVLN